MTQLRQKPAAGRSPAKRDLAFGSQGVDPASDVSDVAVEEGLEVYLQAPGQQGGLRSARPTWGLRLEDRLLLVVVAYWRTNLTMRQLAPLFGVPSTSLRRPFDGVKRSGYGRELAGWAATASPN